MNIHVNNQPITLQKPMSLEALLTHLAQDKQGIALAVNRHIISRSQWATHTISDNDQITLITATAGG